MRFHILLTFGIVVLSCSGSEDDPASIPILFQQFTFHQDVNKLYYGVGVESKYEGQALDSVMIHWYGTNRGNTADALTLFDDGSHGDIIMNDDLYGRKIPNDSTTIVNILGDDSGYVFMDYVAMYGTEIVTVSDSFKIGNIIPRIESIFAPDTIIRPADATVSLHLIKAEVYDADGLGTIKWVGFTSFHVEGDSMMNNGNYIYLHDDGSDSVLYEPNITSGDSIRGDGVYSFRIAVYGTGFTDPDFQTREGTFNWRFLTQDLSNDYSEAVEHEIIIQ
jgi:hypothetical protein